MKKKKEKKISYSEYKKELSAARERQRLLKKFNFSKLHKEKEMLYAAVGKVNRLIRKMERCNDSSMVRIKRINLELKSYE